MPVPHIRATERLEYTIRPRTWYTGILVFNCHGGANCKEATTRPPPSPPGIHFPLNDPGLSKIKRGCFTQAHREWDLGLCDKARPVVSAKSTNPTPGDGNTAEIPDGI